MTTLATALLALLGAASPIRAASADVDVPTSSTVCVAFTARELRDHGDHAFVCVDQDGGIVGAVLHRNGRLRCPVSGVVVGDCVTLSACGQTDTRC